MSHVKEMWAALFEYHKQRCRGKRRVQGQALRHRALCPSPGHSGHWVPWHSHLHAPGRLRPRAILHTHGTPFICCSHYSYLSNSMGLNCAGLNWQGFFFSPNKYVPRYYTTCDWLRPPIQRADYKLICRFPRVRRASAQTPVLFKSQL